MADKPKFKVNCNPYIECVVPGEQTLRETSSFATNGNEVLIQGDLVEFPDTYAPVMKVTKNETSFTKGDLKLQKVTVTEDVSVTYQRLFKRQCLPGKSVTVEETHEVTASHHKTNPVYSLIVDDVISGPHTIRVGGKVKAEAATLHEASISKDPKKRTKIPTFRQTVERVKHGGVDRGTEEQAVVGRQSLQPQPRRSSIPKLQKKDPKHPVKAKSDLPDAPQNKDLDIPKAEEEFEKIFDEIIEDKSIEYMDAIVLPDSKIDPELESNFEEIIHAYDEANVEPEENTGDGQKSRIPLMKQKSLDEAKVLRSIGRTNSLQERVKIKTIDIDDKMPVRQPVYAKTLKEVTKEKELVGKWQAESDKNTNAKPENQPEIRKSKVLRTYNETKIEDNTERKLEHHKEENSLHDWFKPIDLNEQPSISKPKSHYLRREQTHTEAFDGAKTEFKSVMEHNTIKIMSVENGIAMKNKQPEKSFEIETAATETRKSSLADNKEENVLKQTNHFRSAPKDSILETHEVPPVTHEIEEVLQDIPKEETEEEIQILKGRVNRLINQISQLDSIEGQENKKIEAEELPKPKSVLTKIAMFETIEPKHSFKSRIPHISKPKTKTSEQSLRIETVKYEVFNAPDERKPRIIEEVLKTPPLRRKSNDAKADEQETEPEETTRVQQEPNNAKQSVLAFVPETVQIVAQSGVAKDKSSARNGLENLAIDIDRKEKHVDVDDKPLPNYARKPDDFQKEDKINTVEDHPQLDRSYSRHDRTPAGDFEHKSELLKDSNPTTESNESKPRENLIENRLKRLKSSTDPDNTKLERSKSIVDIEIEKSVKGKVLHIIQNMKSVELTETPRREVISVKERPRKKSVMEKIALFERKLTPVAMEGSRGAGKETGQERFIQDTGNVANCVLDGEALKIQIADLNAARAKYGSVSAMPTIELSNGVKMPVLAVGTALLEPALTKAIIGAAIDLGYRAIDTAFIYGNEKLVGEAIRAKIDDGTVKREDLFIMSKLWSTFHRPDLVQKACRASLEALGLDYFDLVMIHNPMSFKEDGDALPTIAGVLQFSTHEYLDAWAPLEGALTLGLTRALGVANLNSEQVARICSKAAYKPVVNQVECHPYLNQQRLSDFCAGHDVRLSCYGSLGSRGTPVMYRSAACVLDEPVVKEVAEELGVSPAEILIRYQLERGHAVVAKASTAVHLWENLQALQQRLPPHQMERLHGLNKNRRNFCFKGMGDTHKNYPFNIPF